MLERFRTFWTGLFQPVINLLLRLGVSPDAVTLFGTIGVVAGALVFFPQGWLIGGVLVITAFVFSDLIDGAMARQSGRTSVCGAFLDSTLDRVGDAAVFGGIALWYAGDGEDLLMVSLCLYCLATGAVVSYARARAEGLGMTADVGVTERADRLVAILVMTGFDGLGVPYVQAAALWFLAVGSTVTIAQRAVAVRRQALAETP